jgi:predicted signal transduction protein with EAL and GGDEF domain
MTPILRTFCRTVDDLIERADLCVYKAKRQGKNQVVADTAKGPERARDLPAAAPG